MIATSHLIPFLLTVYLLILVPGPSVVFTISRGVALGRVAALMTVLGNTAGLATQLVVVVIGLGGVLADSQTVFTVLKLAGAAYLVYLGLRAVLNRHALAAELALGAGAPKSRWRIIGEGYTVGVTNPKGLVIFTAILPNFIARSSGHITVQLASLGMVCVVVALLSDSTWALASGTARAWIGRSERRLQALSVTGGVTMVGLGVVLALTGRRR